MANKEISFPTKAYSWTALSQNIFEKELDKTTFHNNETRIPREIITFFDVNEIKSGDIRDIQFLYNGKSYNAQIEIDRQDPPRTDLKWGTDFAYILRNKLPGWYESYELNKNQDNPPKFRMYKIDSTHYEINFIIDGYEIEESEDEYFPKKEGAVIYFCSKRYERDEKNRKQAIAIHGLRCSCCGFNFKEIYGEYGMGFIEIHHVKPLQTFETEQIVDPKTELFPLCSNCHRMIHIKRNHIISIEELRIMINEKYLELLKIVNLSNSLRY